MTPRRAAALVVPLLAAVAVAIVLAASGGAPPRKATGSPVAMVEEDTQALTHPRRTLRILRSLGVDVLRLNVKWASIAPDASSFTWPTSFNASDPAAYPAGGWAPFDRIVKAAKANGIVVDALQDPNQRVAHTVGFSTGLLFSDRKPKATFYAYRMPIFLPVTKAGPDQALEVWGCVRPFRYAYLDTHRAQYVQIQFRPGSSGPFRTIKTVRITDVRGYLDVHVKFPASGTFRLKWSYPSGDPRLRDPVTPSQTTIYSRNVYVTVA